MFFLCCYFMKREGSFKKVCVLSYIIDMLNMKKINIMVIEISQKMTNFDVSPQGEYHVLYFPYDGDY